MRKRTRDSTATEAGFEKLASFVARALDRALHHEKRTGKIIDNFKADSQAQRE